MIKTANVAPSPTAISPGRGEKKYYNKYKYIQKYVALSHTAISSGEKNTKKKRTIHRKCMASTPTAISAVSACVRERVCVCFVMGVIKTTKVASGSAAISSGREEKNNIKTNINTWEKKYIALSPTAKVREENNTSKYIYIAPSPTAIGPASAKVQESVCLCCRECDQNPYAHKCVCVYSLCSLRVY